MSPAHPIPKARTFRGRHAVVFALVVAAASVLLGWAALQTELSIAEDRFHDRAENYMRAVDARLFRTADALAAIAGLEHASEEVQPHEFERFASDLLVGNRQVQAFARLIELTPEGRKAEEAGGGGGGLAQFQVNSFQPNGQFAPAPQKDRYLAIMSMEPIDPTNAQWIGADILSSPRLSRAANAAISSGLPVMSQTVDTPNGVIGVLVLKAIYRGYDNPVTPADRVDQARGLAAAVVDGARLFGQMPSTFDRVSVRLVGDSTPIYESVDDGSQGVVDALTSFETTLSINAQGQSFTIDVADAVPLSALRAWFLALAVFAPTAIGGLIWNAAVNRRGARLRADADRKKLAASEERFRDFAASTADLFWEMDADLRFSFLSDQYEQMSGNAPSSLLGKTRQESGLPGVDPDIWRQHLDDLANHRPFRNFVHPRIHDDEAVVWISVSGKPIYDDAGVFLGYRGTGSDITEQVRREKELAEAKQEADAANRAKSAFLAAMSHELRTPLNAVIGFAEILQTKLNVAEDTKEDAEFAGHIHASGQHLLSLINDLLDLSKIESGKDELRLADVNVANLAESAERMVAKRAVESEVRVTVEVADDARMMTADRRKLLQILVNLLSNAVKFTRPGGDVGLAVWREDDGSTIFEVRDTGIGMAPEDVPKALSAFIRVGDAAAREVEGTGLGLPLAEKLAAQHGGCLTLESELDVGTTVTVAMPPELAVEDETLEAEAS